MKKIFILLSGGVDSSTAGYLLKQRGFNLIGIYLRVWLFEGCPVEEENYARRTAEKLDIPFYVFDISKDYQERILDYFLKAYLQGLTPNPDVLCNSEIKFGLVLDKVLNLEADFIASGHYARVICNSDCEILRGIDQDKDQSYFLWKIRKEILSRLMMPIGWYYKSQVRKIAQKANLPSAFKKDSQGLCFIGQLKVREFLKKFLPPLKAKIYSIEGKYLGETEDFWYFTLGQRHGLNLGGLKEPYYVAKKDNEKKIIWVAPGDHPSLFAKKIYLQDLNWLVKPLNKKTKMLVKIRYRARFQPGFFDPDENSLTFIKPVRAPTPGQSAVFYQDQKLLGGGIIKEAESLFNFPVL